MGGADRKVSDFLTAGGRPSWSPDGLWLVAARARPGVEPLGRWRRSDGLYLVPVEGGEPRPIPLPEGAGDPYNPKFSPDGRHLAYESCVGLSSCNLDVVELGADFVPKGAPQRLSRRPVWPEGDLAWTRDGKSLLFVDYLIQRLWRVGIVGNEPPTPVELAGLRARHPAIAADRLVFTQALSDADIYRFEPGRPAEPVLASTFAEFNAQFSPDGRRVAFETERSDEGHEIWLANADGSEPVPAHARAGALPRNAPLVAGRPAYRFRLLGRGRALGHLDDRRRWRLIASADARSWRRERTELVT